MARYDGIEEWRAAHMEARVEEARRDLDQLATLLRVVEVEVLVGEEPEEGVEFDVMPVQAGEAWPWFVAGERA